MKATISIGQLAKELPMLFGEKHAIHLLGAPGVGKSALILESAASICAHHAIPRADFAVLTFNLTSVDSLDIRGIPVPTKTATGASAIFTRSPIMEAILRTGCTHGVLLLDEFAQADGMTQKAAAPVILDRMLGADSIPDGWWVVLTSNRAKDKSGAANMLRHIDNRLGTYNMSNDVPSLLSWWHAAHKHPLGAGFIEARPGVVFTDAVPTEPGAFCTPRSFARLWEKIEARGLPIAESMFPTMAGMIGEGAATELLAFMAVADILPTLDEMRTNPARCELPPRSRLDAQYAMSASLVHYASEEDMSWVWTIATRMVPEFQTSIATRCIEKVGHGLMNSPAMASWIARNASLIGAS